MSSKKRKKIVQNSMRQIMSLIIMQKTGEKENFDKIVGQMTTSN